MLRRLSFALALSACSSLPVTLGHVTGDVRAPDVSNARDGRTLATMPGADFDDFVVLPSGDVVLAGRARESFVMRLAPNGDVRWTVTFASCQGILLAAAGDDAVYVFDRAEGTLFPPGTRCDRARVGDHGVLHRLDTRGAIVWRYEAPFSPSWIVASRERVVAGAGGMFSVAENGRAEWSHEDGATWLASGAFVSGSSLVVGGAPASQMPGYHPPTYAPCFLRRVDAASGATTWQKDLAPANAWCIEPQVHVDGELGVVRMHVITDERGARGQRMLAGFASATGETRWEEKDPADPQYGEPFAPLPALEPGFASSGPVIVGYHLAPENVDVPYVIAVDPATGATRPIARVMPSLARAPHFWLADANRAELRAGVVTVAGGFHGSLAAAGLVGDSPHRSGKQCVYDVGFPGSPPMSCAAAVEYDQALFLARMPAPAR